MEIETLARKNELLKVVKPHVVCGNPARRNRVGLIEFYCVVTPAIASYLISLNHPNNRKQRREYVAQYSVDMIEDSFVPECVTIMFCEDYYLANGQHTLNAIVKSGRTLTLRVVFEATKQMVGNIDQARSRNLRDRKKFAGEETKYIERCEAVAKILFGRETKGSLFGSPSPTPAQRERIVDENPQIRESVAATHSVSTEAKGFMKPRDAALCHFLASELGEREKGEQFLAAVASGAKKGNPARAVRISIQNHHHRTKGGADKRFLPGEPRSIIDRQRAIVLVGLMKVLQGRRVQIVKLASFKSKETEEVTVLNVLNSFFKGKPLAGMTKEKRLKKRGVASA